MSFPGSTYKSTRFFNFCNFIRFKIFQNRPPFFHLLLEIFNHGDLPYKVKKVDEANNNFIKNKTKKDHSTKSFSYIISKKKNKKHWYPIDALKLTAFNKVHVQTKDHDRSTIYEDNQKKKKMLLKTEHLIVPINPL